MKTKRIVALFLAGVLLLTGCGSTATNTTDTQAPTTAAATAAATTAAASTTAAIKAGEVVVETVAVAEDDGPKAGGTITMADMVLSMAEPPAWDIHKSPSIGVVWWLNPVQEYLMQGNFLEKGPRGTSENAFALFQAEWAEDLVRGWIVEDWKWSDDPMGVEFKVRKGIKWQDNDSLGIKDRELSAKDVADWINSYRAGAKASKMKNFTDENPAEVKDDSTVFVNFTQPFASWMFVIGYALYANVYPVEQSSIETLGWDQVTGTGPFKITDYTPGVGATYERNADWWAKEVEIDGKTYEAPFADTLSLPLFGDQSTAISALVTGQVDIMTQVPLSYKTTIKTAAPNLNMVEGPSGSSINIRFNVVSGICSDLNFRRALLIGTDNDALTSLVDGGRTGGFPFSYSLGESVYTEIEDMPEDAKVLYGYDPDTAKAMIAESGYNGEEINIYYQNTNTDLVSIAEVLADQWTKLGVNVKLNVLDSATFANYWTGDGTNFEGAIMNIGANSKTSRGIENERTVMYMACATDEKFNSMMDEMMAEPDAAKREALMKEAANYFNAQVNEFGLVETSSLNCWWPWVKNYYGEADSGGSGNAAIPAAYAWIDQDLKKEMGF